MCGNLIRINPGELPQITTRVLLAPQDAPMAIHCLLQLIATG
jgi:hypothetical protein